MCGGNSMNKKLVALILSICFIAMAVNAASAINTKEELEKFTKDIDIPKLDIETLSYAVLTTGPARFITNIKFIEGNEVQINKIKNLMKIRLFKPNFRTVIATNLTFEVTYTRTVKMNSRFSYATAYVNLGADTNLPKPMILPNLKHTVTLKNFTGVFHFIKPKLKRPYSTKLFVPAQFIFVGGAEKVVCSAPIAAI